MKDMWCCGLSSFSKRPYILREPQWRRWWWHGLLSFYVVVIWCHHSLKMVWQAEPYFFLRLLCLIIIYSHASKKYVTARVKKFFYLWGTNTKNFFKEKNSLLIIDLRRREKSQLTSYDYYIPTSWVLGFPRQMTGILCSVELLRQMVCHRQAKNGATWALVIIWSMWSVFLMSFRFPFKFRFVLVRIWFWGCCEVRSIEESIIIMYTPDKANVQRVYLEYFLLMQYFFPGIHDLWYLFKRMWTMMTTMVFGEKMERKKMFILLELQLLKDRLAKWVVRIPLHIFIASRNCSFTFFSLGLSLVFADLSVSVDCVPFPTCPVRCLPWVKMEWWFL